MNDKIKKNLLDLSYNKYLQYFNTTIIIIFTYIIGVGIAFLTNAVDYKEKEQISTVAFVSIIFISILSALLRNFKKHQENIKEEMRKLKI